MRVNVWHRLTAHGKLGTTALVAGSLLFSSHNTQPLRADEEVVFLQDESGEQTDLEEAEDDDERGPAENDLTEVNDVETDPAEAEDTDSGDGESADLMEEEPAPEEESIESILGVSKQSEVDADFLNELRTRIDAVERENANLRQQLELQEVTIRSHVYNLADPMDPRAGEAAGDAAPAKQEASKPADPLIMSGKWNNGLELQTADKKFRVHVGGRIQMDGVWFKKSEAFLGSGGVLDQDSVDFRRARLRVDGTMFEFIDWATEFDFVNSVNDNPGTPTTEANTIGVPAPTDLWMNFGKLPILGNIRVGNVKEPIGMEHLTSSRYLEFLERSFNQDLYTGAFNNGFTPGIMVFNTFAEEQGTWSTGVFKNTTNAFAFGVGDGEYAWTSRATYLLWYEDEGADLFHVGVAGSIRDPNDGRARLRSRAGLRNGPGALNPLMADTATFFTNQQEILACEASWNRGPLCIQAEYMGSWNDNVIPTVGPNAGVQLGEVFTYGWYCEALYFLTGEHREYERKAGVYARQKVLDPFAPGGGIGAWQIGARYAKADLRNAGLDGGVVQDVTIGINWFLNPNVKFQGNYVLTDRDAPFNVTEGLIHGFGLRLAYDF